jgi:hypothetical protein
MPRDFWLIYLQNFHEETYANFFIANQINQPQTRAIRQRLEEQCDTIFFGGHAVFAYPIGS